MSKGNVFDWDAFENGTLAVNCPTEFLLRDFMLERNKYCDPKLKLDYGCFKSPYYYYDDSSEPKNQNESDAQFFYIGELRLSRERSIKLQGSSSVEGMDVFNWSKYNKSSEKMKVVSAEFDWGLFKEEPYFSGKSSTKLAVHCPTRILDLDFCVEGFLNGFNFNFGDILKNTGFLIYGEDTCYVGEDGRCDSYENLKNQGYGIYEWADFFKNKPTPKSKPKKKFDWNYYLANKNNISIKCDNIGIAWDFCKERVSNGIGSITNPSSLDFYWSHEFDNTNMYFVEGYGCFSTSPGKEDVIFDWRDYIIPENALATRRSFNWYLFCNTELGYNSKMDVHCATESLAYDFCEEMHDHHLKWDSGNSYYGNIYNSMWIGGYDSDICYTNSGSRYSSTEDIRKKYNMIEWSDYCENEDIYPDANLFTLEYVPLIKELLKLKDMYMRTVSEANLDLSQYKGKPYAIHYNNEALAIKLYRLLFNSGLSTKGLRIQFSDNVLYTRYTNNSCITMDGSLCSVEEAKKQGYEILNLVEE